MKKVGDFSCDPYVTAFLNALLWVVYGSPAVKLQVLVLTINSTGAALEFLYIVIYCVYAPRDGRVSSFYFLIRFCDFCDESYSYSENSVQTGGREHRYVYS